MKDEGARAAGRTVLLAVLGGLIIGIVALTSAVIGIEMSKGGEQINSSVEYRSEGSVAYDDLTRFAEESGVFPGASPSDIAFAANIQCADFQRTYPRGVQRSANGLKQFSQLAGTYADHGMREAGLGSANSDQKAVLTVTSVKFLCTEFLDTLSMAPAVG